MSPVLAFGDDRSEAASRCWEWIVDHRWDGWGLEIITAEPPADMHPVAPEEAELHPWQPDEPRDAAEGGFSSVEHLRAEVDPRIALIARPWDLVAIGPRGSGFLKSLHLGSTADWLLREPASPLVIARQPGPVTRVLLAADGSAHAKRTTACLAAIPWIQDVTVEVVAVDDGQIDIESALTSATEVLSVSGAGVTTVALHGSPTRAISERIEETTPHLVAMGAKGSGGGLKQLVLGSTTAAIAGSTQCSILVAHAQGDDDA